MYRLVILVILTGCRLHFEEVPGDAAGDVGERTAMFASETHAHATNATGATLATSVAGDGRFMLVALQIGTSCGATSIPSVSSVTYDGMPLIQGPSIVGSPCSAASARSELWQLVAPPIGSANVVVTLSSSAITLHTSVLQFTDVSQTNPIREAVTMSGQGTSSSLSVASAPGDLVADVVGHGTMIVSAGAAQMVQIIDNNSFNNTLDSTAMSTEPGAAPTVTASWTFNGVDEWQHIVVSLRP